MAHTPVNHPLRPLYRALGLLVGAYLVVFAIVGFIQTSGESFTGDNAERALGQGTNLLWSILSLIFGAIILATSVIGRNLDVEADKYVGWTLLVIGSYELATNRTDANFFGFTMSTVVVTYLVGVILITAGLYSKVAAPGKAGAPRQVREGRTA
ncbi:protein of unknown function [Paractinoplanes atraurantiacus]|uniref:DUF4383 domain-containing protein n=2 Tax=Paractinoplanes atraurantiacus TaxID=1036182 RepID=A0A285F389_9ACTN|nr:DUF4383 domain-containing protein [Actinoplanes atraurantiacus]SNY05738.1 protein of unknown function [Actinoplanes atraurantiacus]